MPDFNKGQKEAIRHVKGPMLALAGPGSGKTTVLVNRIRYLIENAGVASKHILVITFTRASAKEMEERFYRLMGDKSARCTFGTFHSVFFYILKKAYGYRASDIVTEEEKYNWIREIIRRMHLEYEDEEDVVASLIQEIGMMKGDMIQLDHFYSGVVGEEVFRDIYRAYEARVTGEGKLDFDDMMVYCLELLRQRADILKSLQQLYQYILVDEFQDINRIQYEITRLLAAPQNNLFIVGDDDQSIYGFRGARPDIMLHFKEDYPDVKIARLSVNYRCSRNIVEGAARLIVHNHIRYEKKLESKAGCEEPIQVHHMKTLAGETEHVLKTIQQYHAQGMPYREMAVILRTNIQSRGIAGKLMAFNIPFQIRDKVPCIYDHFTARTILDYMQAAKGNRDRSLFLRIMNKPKRYIARDLLEDPVVSLHQLKRQAGKKEWLYDNICQMEYELKILAGLKPYAAVNFIRKAIGYDEYLTEYAQYRHIPVEDLYAVLDELQEMAKAYGTYEEWVQGIEDYRQELARHTDKRTADPNSITVTTMHSAKGLEFDAVFLLEANEGLTPYKKAVTPDELEEERRMFYVAMTRARHHLHIYEVREYYNKELAPSRFLSELLEQTPQV